MKISYVDRNAGIDVHIYILPQYPNNFLNVIEVEDANGTTSFMIDDTEENWFVSFLGSKSSFLLPQIVEIMKDHRGDWFKVKQELIKL